MDESVVKHLEQTKVGTLKLSEAIRIGAKLRPHARGSFFDGFGTCALGAAAEARGWKPSAEDVGSRQSPYEYLTDTDPYLRGAITSKNDHSELSREEIADWLEAKGY